MTALSKISVREIQSTFFVFLHNIMMKEFVGSQNNKKKLAQDPKGTHGHPDIQMQLGRSDIQLSQHINLKLIKRNNKVKS